MMMRRILPFLLLLFVTLQLFSNPISVKKAVKLANKYANNAQLDFSRFSNKNLVYSRYDKNGEPAFYVFSKPNEGFIIISAEELTFPVLAYSENSEFVPTNIPCNLRSVLDRYCFSVEDVRDRKVAMTPEIKVAREAQLNNEPEVRTSVDPLLGNIKWAQMPYYNALCPSGCPVGCVATAMVQIMKYYDYPEHGQGSHTYYSPYGYLSADFDVDYDWDAMPEGKLSEPNEECAKISYHCAVSVEMNFGPNGSGAYTSDVPSALKTYFKYKDYCNYAYSSDYSVADWKSFIRTELDEERPVEYAGYSSSGYGGHAFVCDGYKENGFFHFNWGWGGSYDGFYQLDNMVPGGSNFSYFHSMVYNIEPDVESDCLGVTNLIGTSDESTVMLSWDAPDLTGTTMTIEDVYYKVYRNGLVIGDDITETVFYQYNAMGGEHNYCVKAVYPDCYSTKECVTVSVLCAPVENLVAEVQDRDVTITWESPYSKEYNSTGTFNVYRNGKLIRTGLSEMSFTDNKVQPGNHEYCVAANYPECISEQVCVEVIVENTCTPVTNLILEQQNNNMAISWEPSIIQGAKYFIYRDEEVIKAYYTQNTYLDENVTPGNHLYCVKVYCDGCYSEQVCENTNVSAIENISEIKLHPNPAEDIITISGVDVKSVKVYDILGQLVNTYSVNTIDVSNFTEGVYFFNIELVTGVTEIIKVMVR